MSSFAMVAVIVVAIVSYYIVKLICEHREEMKAMELTAKDLEAESREDMPDEYQEYE